MTERRRKIIPISSQLLTELFSTSDRAMMIRCTDGLPPDARFIGHGYAIERDMHYLVFESDAWERVPEFDLVPILSPVFVRYHIAPLLQQAARLIADTWDGTAPDSAGQQWLAEYAHFKDVL